MYTHDDIDSMLQYIHESIKHDCERHIMLNRISLGLPPYPVDNMRGLSKPIILAAPINEMVESMVESNVIPYINLKASIIDEKKLKGFKEGTIFDWTKNYIFPTVRGKSWFWLKMLMLERYYTEQKRLLLTDMSNHNKPNIDSVIWWNLPLILYAVKIIKDQKLDELSYDSIPYLDLMIVRKMILDIDPWKDALRYFKMNYTDDLKISKWKMSPKIKNMRGAIWERR